MPFGNKLKDQQCMVFEYGCLPPIEGENELISVLYKRNALWNKLVEIDHGLEKKFRDLIRESVELAGFSADEFEALEQDVISLRTQRDELRAEITRRRQAARSGRVDISDLSASLKQVQSEYRQKNAEYRKIKKAAREANRIAFETLEAERKEAVRDALHSANLWWCNWGEEQIEYENARRRVLQERSKGKPVSLRFHRFDGSGKVTVRLRERGLAGPWGMPVPAVFEPNNAFWIEPVPAEAWESPVRAIRRKAARTVVYFRIDSNKKQPVWVVLPMVMHRPLPSDGEIRAASIVRERVGRRYRYKVVIVVAVKELPRRFDNEKTGYVRIRLGWSMCDGSLRVATWTDYRGKTGQLVLPPEVMHELTKPSELQSIRDTRFNEIKAKLHGWLKKASIPDWLKEEAENLPAWRSQGRLVGLIHRWCENRFDGDGEIWPELEAWLRKENHLYDWEANLRDQAKRRRREIYRIFAADLVRRYGKIIVERPPLARLARKPAPERGTAKTMPGDRLRFLASPSTLETVIANACRREGVEMVIGELSQESVS